MMTLFKKILPVVFVLLFAGCKRDYAEGYQFITKDFKQAVNQVNAQFFFAPELPAMPSNGSAIPHQTKEEIHKGIIGRHYEDLGQELCRPIAESFSGVIENGMRGDDIFAFDRELNKAMQEAGAYVLPLRIVEGRVKANYYNVNWKKEFKDKFLKLYEESTRSYGRYGPVVEYKDDGEVSVTERFSESWGSNISFNVFHDFAIKQGLKIQDFSGDFDFIHGYLFVFMKNPNDLNEEGIFYYVDFPFHVSENKYSQASALDLRPYGQVKCYTLSTSSLFYYGVTVPVRFIEQGLPLAPITDIEPLTVPLNKEYAMDKVPNSNGGFGLVKNDGYYVAASEIAEPSMKCWLLLLGYFQGDVSECQDTGYYQEYAEMLNKNICIWKDKITYAPKITYPYKVNAGKLKPQYSHVADFINRCSSEPYAKIEREAP